MCRNEIKYLILLLMLFTLAMHPDCSQAQAVAKDQPGMESIEYKEKSPIANAAANLKPIECLVEQSSSFVKDPLASLSIQIRFTRLYGRVDLIPAGKLSSNEPARFFLHGQKSESVKIQPGEYVAHFAFWLPEENLASAYPLTTEIKLSKAQIAKIELNQTHYETIRQWLNSISQQRKEQLNKKRSATEKNVNIQN